jgi:hypothetical protein
MRTSAVVISQEVRVADSIPSEWMLGQPLPGVAGVTIRLRNPGPWAEVSPMNRSCGVTFPTVRIVGLSRPDRFRFRILGADNGAGGNEQRHCQEGE